MKITFLFVRVFPSISESRLGNGLIVNEFQTLSSDSIFKHTHLWSDKTRDLFEFPCLFI